MYFKIEGPANSAHVFFFFFIVVLCLFSLSLLFLSEPDVGMAEKDSYRFFQQLKAAVVNEANLC